jgi:SAM-dependent methyltransferase
VRAFADHFSRLATGYAAHRPRYPQGLFAAIAAASAIRGTVWDCATGSGQAAPGLAAHFQSVLASDASGEQVRAAAPHHRVRYFVARAEAVPLPSRSVCMVTVAQALHWLELPEFYAEARRVLQPGGLLVAWTYGRQRVGDVPVDEVLNDFYDHVVGPYWAPERRWVETGYRTLRFPFDETAIEAPPMLAEWSLPQLLGYIATWSAVDRCRESTGRDPLVELAGRLTPLWGDPSTSRRVEWPLSVRAGR